MRTIYATLVILALSAAPVVYVLVELGPPPNAEAAGALAGRVLGPFIIGALVAGVAALVLRSARSRRGFLGWMNWTALVVLLASLLGTLANIAQG